MDWLDVIQTIGFPIASVIACAWFIAKNVDRDRNESKEREDKLIDANIKSSEALDKVADTINQSNDINKELSETNKMLVDTIENKLDTINSNVEKVLDNLAE